jgi:[ribosomal protein S18]-alanine N-acetyltransferase
MRSNIQPATNEDRTWAAALMEQSEPWLSLGTTRAQCETACHHPEHLVYIAHIDGHLSGVIIIHPRGLAGSPYIKSICVDRPFRGQGVGRELIAFAENLFKGNEKHIFLCVSDFNQGAQAFYKRLGFTQVGEFKDYVIAGAKELLLHKSLH